MYVEYVGVIKLDNTISKEPREPQMSINGPFVPKLVKSLNKKLKTYKTAFNSKDHSSNTTRYTPIFSTCSGPSSSYRIETQGQLLGSPQWKSLALFCCLLFPCQALGHRWKGTNSPLNVFWSQRDSYIVDWIRETARKIF